MIEDHKAMIIVFKLLFVIHFILWIRALILIFFYYLNNYLLSCYWLMWTISIILEIFSISLLYSSVSYILLSDIASVGCTFKRIVISFDGCPIVSILVIKTMAPFYSNLFYLMPLISILLFLFLNQHKSSHYPKYYLPIKTVRSLLCTNCFGPFSIINIQGYTICLQFSKYF